MRKVITATLALACA
jgi:hypothetical protein